MADNIDESLFCAKSDIDDSEQVIRIRAIDFFMNGNLFSDGSES